MKIDWKDEKLKLSMKVAALLAPILFVYPVMRFGGLLLNVLMSSYIVIFLPFILFFCLIKFVIKFCGEIICLKLTVVPFIILVAA